jgi:hypothetical protein
MQVLTMLDKVAGPALRGIQRGLDGIRRNAHDIATHPIGTRESPGDLARSFVQTKQRQQQTAAGVKALQASHETLGRLLDVRA